MKFYLSSYRIGDNPGKLSELFSNNRTVGYIPNALDFTTADPRRKKIHIERDMEDLKAINLFPILLNLRDYFGSQKTLKKELQEFEGLWICGGNVFVLRQAMKLCGLDSILVKGDVPDEFVYAGYSAGACVLSPNLKGYESYSIHADDATDFPYEEQKETIWEGLNLIPYFFMPHYDSDHPKVEDIRKKVAYYKLHNIPCKAVRDGKVVVIT